MDKFAVLQIKKKKAREEALRAQGFASDEEAKYKPTVLSDEEQSELNKAFGYPHEPTDVNCVNKFTPPNNFSAAVWWTWQGVWEDAQKVEAEAAAAKVAAAKEAARLEAEAIAAAAAQAAATSAKIAAKKSRSILEEDSEEEEEEVDWSAVTSKKPKGHKVPKAKLTKEEKKALAIETEKRRLEEKRLEEIAKEEAFEAELKHSYQRASILTHWEIARYKREPPGLPGSGDPGGWKFKGAVLLDPVVENGRLRMQTVLTDLGENNEYRFTVRAVNGRGRGKESLPSNSVMIERDLPPGWFRFFSEQLGKQYYANIKTNQSSWDRPDLDPYFLDESVVLTFNQAELRFLKGIYVEEHEHFRAVLRERFHDVLRETGERMSKFRIFKLFRGYAKDEFRIDSFQVYMDVMMHIKKKKIASSMQNIAQAGANARLLVKQQLAATLLTKNDKDKFQKWSLEYSTIAERQYYLNKETKKKQWDMPDEIRFYLPPKLERKLHAAFDFGHLEVFKQYFSMLDVDSSGDLSDVELRMLLEALGVHLDDAAFQTLVLTVDLNGNGTIEYDEFCWMMFELARTDSKSALGDIADLTAVLSGGQGEGGLNVDLHQVSTNLAAIKARKAAGGDVPTGQDPLGGIVVTSRGDIQPPLPSAGAATGASAGAVGAAQASLSAREKPVKPPFGGVSTKGASTKTVAFADTAVVHTPDKSQVQGQEGESKEGPGAGESGHSLAQASADQEQEAEAGAEPEGEEEGEEEEEEEEEWVDEVEEGEDDSPEARKRALHESQQVKLSTGQRFFKSITDCLNPSAAAAAKSAEEARMAAEQKKRDKIAERQRKNRDRDTNSAHGPFCFCGCRHY